MTFPYLKSEDVLAVAGYACDGMRVAVCDLGPLEPAVHRPSAPMFGEEAYPDLSGKAAAPLQASAVDHPFVDGDKRTAWLSCVTFLSLHGERLRPDTGAAEAPVIAVATGEVEDVKVIGERLRLLGEAPAL